MNSRLPGARTEAPVTMRPEVERFAGLMESRLAAKDAEYGREGWKTATDSKLMDLLDGKMEALDDAMSVEARDSLGIARLAADLANYAMMLADYDRQLAPGTADMVMGEEERGELRSAFTDTEKHDG